MTSVALTAGLEIAGLLFKIGAAALERSDNATARKVAGLGKSVVAGVQTSGRIDTAVANDVRAMAEALDKDGVPDRAEWEALASKVRAAADRWKAAG